MVDFHQTPQAENVRLRRNEGPTRLGGDDGALREDSGLACRHVESCRWGRVDQLVEAQIEIGINKQSILVTPDIVEHNAALCCGDDQSSMFVDGVSYF
jgi:hypothetical protein